MPTITPALLAFEKALQSSKFRKEFEAEYGKQMFVSMELQEKSFCEANIPLMQREAELTDEYREDLWPVPRSNSKEKKRNLYGLQKFFEAEDRKGTPECMEGLL